MTDQTPTIEPRRKVRARYDYGDVAFIMKQSRRWVRYRVSVGDIEATKGRVPLREMLRLTGLSIEEFREAFGEEPQGED